MLTGELVRVRVVKGEVKAGFIDPTDRRLLTRAEDLLAAFEAHQGRRRSELDEALAAVEGDGVDHKLTRGLAKLVADRSEFDVSAPVPPEELRAEVFRRAARLGPLAPLPMEGGRPTVDEIWAGLGAERGLDPALLAAALYADHADQQVLLGVDVPGAEWLLHRYNVALVQAALLKCEVLRVQLARPAVPRLRQLLRAAKFHQLLFTCSRDGDDYVLTLDGPTSLFQQNTRYGLALGRFFPALLLLPGTWSLEATLMWGRVRRPLRLGSDAGLRSHYQDRGAYETREATWFRARWLALESGWALDTDPTPLDQGGEAVVVPDFSFRKGRRVAHLEILGFWRKGTVPRRLALLARHGPPNLVLAVSSRLSADGATPLPESVVPFAEVIPARKVLERVEAVAITERARPVRPRS